MTVFLLIAICGLTLIDVIQWARTLELEKELNEVRDALEQHHLI